MRFTLLLLSAFLVPALRAQVSPVSVRVEQVAGHSASKGAHEQKRSLKVFTTNNSATDFSGLKVKYFYFGKDVKTGDVSVIEKGERGADVKARTTDMTETPAVTTKYTDDRSEKSGGKGGNNKGGSYKKVEGTGNKIIGHGVQVFAGDKLLAEFFSEPSLKAKAR
ncbi:MAG: hypothetical protein ABMA13_16465 [Chthoniobacteraceae bacterium]